MNPDIDDLLRFNVNLRELRLLIKKQHKLIVRCQRDLAQSLFKDDIYTKAYRETLELNELYLDFLEEAVLECKNNQETSIRRINNGNGHDQKPHATVWFKPRKQAD